MEHGDGLVSVEGIREEQSWGKQQRFASIHLNGHEGCTTREKL